MSFQKTATIGTRQTQAVTDESVLKKSKTALPKRQEIQVTATPANNAISQRRIAVLPTLILFIPKAPPQRLSFHNICPDGRTQIYILVYHNLPSFSSINIKSHKNVLFCNKTADNHQPNKVPIPNDKPRHSPPPQFRPTASAVQSPRIIAERLRISETAVFSYSIKSSTFPQPPFPPRRRSCTPPAETPPETRTSTHEKKQPEHNLLKKNEIVGSPIYNRGIL